MERSTHIGIGESSRFDMAGFFQLSARADGQFVFQLLVRNRGVLLTSQAYGSRQAARVGIESVRKNSRLVNRIVRMVDDETACHFVVLSETGLIIGTSETYASRAALEEAIRTVMTFGATTVIRQPSSKSGSRDPVVRRDDRAGAARSNSH